MKKFSEAVVVFVTTWATMAAAAKLRASAAPPEPSGFQPGTDPDGSFGNKTYACAACKFQATGSCAMYKTCLCYATNTFFHTIGQSNQTDGDSFATDANSWHWACGNEGGDKYELCFKTEYRESEKVYLDNFGDPVDPNNPKCGV